MAEKETIMVLKVDLQCCRCYKKVKKVLCKFPQIRDQKYDEKANTVTITVVSCCPEKIKDKIYCKGGGSIKCITIKPPTPTPPPPQPPPPPPPPLFFCMVCIDVHIWDRCYFGGPPPRPCCVNRGDCLS